MVVVVMRRYQYVNKIRKLKWKARSYFVRIRIKLNEVQREPLKKLLSICNLDINFVLSKKRLHIL